MSRIHIMLYLLSSIVSGYSLADETPTPDPGSNRQPVEEPRVTIIKREGQTIEEYRVKGQLYMVKITPRKGFTYYLIDTDGDGQLDTRQNELDEGIQVPQWILFKWK